MVRVCLSVFILLLLTSYGHTQASNPARQSAQQRGTQPPADGLWYVYDRDGNLSKEESYASYRLGGITKKFYPSGSLESTTPYIDGRREGLERVYYKKGGLKEENLYKDNNLHGTSHEYYESGALKRDAHYVRGQLDGVTKDYFENGLLKQIWNYDIGVVNGSQLTYGEDGQVTMEDNYQNGVLVAHKDYTQDIASFTSAKKAAVKTEQAPTIPTPLTQPTDNTQKP